MPLALGDYKGNRNIWKGSNSIMYGAIATHGDRIVKDIKGFKPRKVMNNTVEYYLSNSEIEDFTRVIRLHDTDIVIMHPDGRIELNSDGWKTPTTKQRINEFLVDGIHLWQTNRRWIVAIPTDLRYYQGKCWKCGHKERIDDIPASEIYHKGSTCAGCGESTFYGSWYTKYDEYPFFDGITIKYKKVLNPREEDPRIGKLEKLINRYCNKIGKLESIPMPSSGDCWYCLGETQLSANLNQAEYGVLHKDGTLEKKNWEATHCLEAHLEECYIHGSLIYNALRYSGRNPEIFLQMGLTSDIRRAVRKYFRAKLQLVR